MAIAAKYFINFSASATPIEELYGNNEAGGTDNTRIVHSDIDKSVGGGIEISCGTDDLNVGYKLATSSVTTTTSLNDISGLSLTGIDFLMVSIKGAVDDDGLISVHVVKVGGTGGSAAGYLKKVGDTIMLRPNGASGASIIVYSASTKLANIEYLWGKEI